MDKIGSWNVRGLNGKTKQGEVRKFFALHQIGLIGLLETKIKSRGFPKFYQAICPGWGVSSNIQCSSSARIIVCWNPHKFYVSIVGSSAQFIHCKVLHHSTGHQFACTFVYASNDLNERYDLWNSLMMLGQSIASPWLVCGDFNNPLFLNERMGSPVLHYEIEGFRNCVDNCGLMDVKASGCFFTWNNKQSGEHRVFSKIDRMLVNESWLDLFPESLAHFLPEGLFDHSPPILDTHPALSRMKKPFKYFNMWGQDSKFLEKVRDCWVSPILGTPMFQVVTKLKKLKPILKALNREGFSEIHVADHKALMWLYECQ